MKRFNFDLPRIIQTNDLVAFRKHLDLLSSDSRKGVNPQFTFFPLGFSPEFDEHAYVLFEREMKLTKEELFSMKAAKASYDFAKDDMVPEDYDILDLGDVQALYKDDVFLICREDSTSFEIAGPDDTFLMVLDEDTNRFYCYFNASHAELPQFGFNIDAANSRDIEWCVRTVQANMDAILRDSPVYRMQRDAWKSIDAQREANPQEISNLKGRLQNTAYDAVAHTRLR